MDGWMDGSLLAWLVPVLVRVGAGVLACWPACLSFVSWLVRLHTSIGYTHPPGLIMAQGW